MRRKLTTIRVPDQDRDRYQIRASFRAWIWTMSTTGTLALAGCDLGRALTASRAARPSRLVVSAVLGAVNALRALRCASTARSARPSGIDCACAQRALWQLRDGRSRGCRPTWLTGMADRYIPTAAPSGRCLPARTPHTGDGSKLRQRHPQQRVPGVADRRQFQARCASRVPAACLSGVLVLTLTVGQA